MTTYSLSRSVFGDVDSSRSQLGIGWSGIINQAQINLWSINYACNHYCIDPLVPLILNMPGVGVNSGEAQPGHWVVITNTGSSNITLQTISSNPIEGINPGCAIMLIADNNSPVLWTVVYNTSKTSTRIGVDTSGNPGPLNGLLIPPGTPEFNMPLTVVPDPGLNVASPYINNPKGLITVGADTITLEPGEYRASIAIIIIGLGATQNHGMFVQLIENSMSIFMGPPAIASGAYTGEVITSPINAVGWFANGSCTLKVDTQIVLGVKCLFNNDTDVEISLTSNVSIEQI